MGKRKTDAKADKEPGAESANKEPESTRRINAQPREQLKALREQNGLTRKALADKVQASSESVYFWEKGWSTPYPHYRPLLAEALHISLEEVEALLAEHPATASCWMVPYARNSAFIGRQALLETLYTAFQTRASSGLIQAITGLGGIGKTQLAVEYAYRFAVDQPIYKTVLWASASSQEDLLLAYTAIAKNLSLIRQKQQDQQEIVEAVKRWLTSHHEWLFILDNVEDLSLVQTFLPQGKEPLDGQVLLTTRLQAVGPGNISICEVRPLEHDDSIRLLLQRARLVERDLPANLADQDAADRFCQELAGLPLALDQAGAYIEETGCTIHQYAQRYQEQRTLLLRRRGAQAMQVLHPEPVSVTFLLSLTKIEQASPAAADLLRFCAFLAPDAIPEDLLSRCRQSDARKHTESLPVTLQELAGNPLLFDEAIAVIRQYSLLHRFARQAMVSIHRVVQAVIQDDLTEQGQRQTWEKRVVSAIATLFVGVGQETLLTAHYEPYIPQALACIEVIHQARFKDQSAAHLLFLMGFYLRRCAHYQQAEELCQEALALYQQLLGPEHPEIASNLVNLAQVSEEKRQHRKAQEYLERAVAILEKAGPAHTLAHALALCNLAQCYWFQGKFAETERILHSILPVLQTLEGAETARVALALVQLATLYRDTKRLQQAEHLYQQALDIIEHLPSPDPYPLALCLEAFATNDMFQGKLDLSEGRYRKALVVFEEIGGKEHPDVAGCLCRLADLCLARGKFEESERNNRRAWAIYAQVGGPDYLEINQPLQGLAMLSFLMKKDNAQAEMLYKQAISLIEKSQGPEHPDLVAALYGYAQVLLAQNRREEAEKMVQRSRTLERKIAGDQTPL